KARKRFRWASFPSGETDSGPCEKKGENPMRHRCLFLVLSALLVIPAGVKADNKDPSKSNLPLQLKLVAKKDTYKSDISSADLKKLIEASKQGGRLPPPPAVEMSLEIVNRTDKEVQFWFRGDP